MTVTVRHRIEFRSESLGLSLPPRAVDQFLVYWSLLERWNRTINLTALPLAGLPDAAIDRLLLEPAVAAGLVPDEPIGWFDLGSGGGSPAIPLKILRPLTRLTMVESKSRKSAFLREAIRELGMSGATVLPLRIEALPALNHAMVEVATIRGTRLNRRIAGVISSLLAPSGRLLTFSGQADQLDLVNLQAIGFEQVDVRRLPSSSASLRVWKRRDVSECP